MLSIIQPRLKILINPEQMNLCLSDQVLCFRVTGCTGGSVMFKCKTNDQHKGKYFCRDRDCRTGISTETQHRWIYDGRFSLYDDENSRFFTVNVSLTDAGVYWCGAETRHTHLTSVSLTNKHELTLSSKPELTSSSMYSDHKPCSSIIHASIVECMKSSLFSLTIRVFYLYFALFIALCCVLRLNKMSVNLADNVMAENYSTTGF
uniref:Ig-like domain-containing protein n=1 Tax=Cyprinus carpio carpio TaxID=630221 RepID=A0A8C1EFK9_CYPCA